ncbi:Formate dehydrogenase O beta subunit [Desulfosporosinus sp. I2]|nr:Formate dehydrogenase O beta subunit [Desulfosporosinus sp. I2]
MTRKMVFVDTSKCTGCKACSVACKEWNELPAEKTQLLTSYQTQNAFTTKTWTYMTFIENMKIKNELANAQGTMFSLCRPCLHEGLLFECNYQDGIWLRRFRAR